MNVLVDTAVWSLVLRRRRNGLSAEEQATVSQLADLLDDDRVRIIGPIRQEVLSGIRDEAVFRRLRDRLDAFSDENLETEDYVEAARWFNACRAQGVAGSAIDLLICAASVRRRLAIFTTDRDFLRYAKILPLMLFSENMTD